MRTFKVFYTPVFLRHETGNHFENAARLTACLDVLAGRLPGAPGTFIPERASQADIRSVHDGALVDFVKATAAAGGGMADPDTVISAESFEAALYAAGAAVNAARTVIAQPQGQALALVRPPGHHASRSHAMGFCLFNNIAIAARLLLRDHKIGRIAILDFDVHHGNGTQDIFYDDPRVLTVSFHRHPFYPGTGRSDETGASSAEGANINVPLAYDTPATRYLDLWHDAMRDSVRPFEPEAILVSAGFDAYRYDPIGGLNFDVDDFRILGELIREVAEETCDGRVASVLEGGYDLDALPHCLAAYLEGLEALQRDTDAAGSI